MPTTDPHAHSAIRATASLAADLVKMQRDGTWDEDDLPARLLPVLCDLEQTFALLAHLARLTVRASEPAALAFELSITEKLGLKTVGDLRPDLGEHL